MRMEVRYELDVLKTKCLGKNCRVIRIDRVSNEKVRHRVDVRENMRDVLELVATSRL